MEFLFERPETEADRNDTDGVAATLSSNTMIDLIISCQMYLLSRIRK